MGQETEQFIRFIEIEITEIRTLSKERIFLNTLHESKNHIVVVLVTRQYIYKQKCMKQKLNFADLMHNIDML